MSFDPSNPPKYPGATQLYLASPTPTNGFKSETKSESKPEPKPEVKKEETVSPPPPPTILSLPEMSKQAEEFAKRVIRDTRDARSSERKPSVSTRIRQAHRVMRASAPVVASSTRLFLDITKAVGAFAQEVENAEHGKYPQQNQQKQGQKQQGGNNHQQKNPQKNQKDKHDKQSKKSKRNFADSLLDELIAWTIGALKALVGAVVVGLLALLSIIAPPFSGILLLAFLLPSACALFILHVYHSR